MASKRAVRRKQCAGKARHATREDALGAMGVHEYLHGSDRAWPMHVYGPCEFCRGYHLGHEMRQHKMRRAQFIYGES